MRSCQTSSYVLNDEELTLHHSRTEKRGGSFVSPMMNYVMISKDGIKMQFATNHVGHFLLAQLLLETMKKISDESNVEGRTVNVSSEGHRFAYKEGIRFAKLNDEEEYSTIAAYGQSKLANILHAK
ncbi:hypothetical protein ZWY2020_054231 [Hordeum vulgare]|nr:hypothetical protein ZWY2020_054231 [Hordeum vulgare]